MPLHLNTYFAEFVTIDYCRKKTSKKLTNFEYRKDQPDARWSFQFTSLLFTLIAPRDERERKRLAKRERQGLEPERMKGRKREQTISRKLHKPDSFFT